LRPSVSSTPFPINPTAVYKNTGLATSVTKRSGSRSPNWKPT
jgi:hypothetical protein